MIQFRKATIEDTSTILELIKGLAKYEKMENLVVASIETLEKELFIDKRAEVILATKDSNVVGFALYFYNFSTFKGKKGLYLEDLYILPDYRNLGIGNLLFEHLKKIAKENNCGRMEWVCLDWNTPAIEFYKSKKAKSLDDWITFRIDETDF